MNVSWYWGTDSSCPNYMGTNSSVTNGTWNMTDSGSNFSTNGETYYWKLQVNDGHGGWTNETYHFTTLAANKEIMSRGQSIYSLEMNPDGTILYGYVKSEVVNVSIDTNWHYVSLTYDGSNLKLYKDGEEVDSTSLSGAISTTDNNLLLGEYMTGTLDELRVSDTARGAAWINTTYQNTNSPTTFATFGTQVGALTAWSYRKQIWINASQIENDLPYFPVLVSTTDANLKNNAHATGNDIIFTNSSVNWSTGSYSDRLPHEIEKWDDSTGELVAWVNVTSLSSTTNTSFYMYYGSSICTTNRENATGVWDSNYVGVWHFKETSAPILDSTGNDIDLTVGAGTPEFGEAGKVANSYENANGEYLIHGDDAALNLTGEFSVSCWFNPVSISSGVILAKGPHTATAYMNYQVGTGSGGTKMRLRINETNSDSNVHGLNTGTWHYLGWTFKDSTNAVEWYINGTVFDTGSNALAMETNSDNLSIGAADCDGVDYVTAHVDELRLSKIVRNQTWIGATYNTTNDSGSFLDFGAQEIQNIAPVLSSPSPSDGATDTGLNPTLSITVADANADAMDVTFMTNASGSWAEIGSTNSSVYNGTYTRTPSNMNDYITKYWWSVNVTDGEDWTNTTYSFTTMAQPQNWWNTEWSYRKLLTIESDQVPSTLTNFPVLVYRASDSDLSSNALSNGSDIAFVLFSDNTTKLNHEIENYTSATGQLVAWVNVTSVSSSTDTKIWMYYGNSTASSQQNVEDTWNSDYVMVQHMNDSTATTTLFDSTSNNYDGTKASAGNPLEVTGKINNSQDFSSDSVNLGNLIIAGATEGTISAWFKYDSLTTPYDYIDIRNSIVARAGDPTDSGLGLADDSEVLTIFHSGVELKGTTVLTSGAMYHAASTWDTNEKNLYLNGSVEANIGTGGTWDGGGGFPTYIGMVYPDYNFGYQDGIIYEVRISSVLRNTSWMAATYNTMQNTTTFVTFGSEQPYS